MGSRQRSHHYHITWSAAWLELVDRQGDRVGEWAEHVLRGPLSAGGVIGSDCNIKMLKKLS